MDPTKSSDNQNFDPNILYKIDEFKDVDKSVIERMSREPVFVKYFKLAQKIDGLREKIDNISIGKLHVGAEKFDEYRKEYAATIEDLERAAFKMKQFCVKNAPKGQKSKYANLKITNKLKKMMEKEKRYCSKEATEERKKELKEKLRFIRWWNQQEKKSSLDNKEEALIFKASLKDEYEKFKIEESALKEKRRKDIEDQLISDELEEKKLRQSHPVRKKKQKKRKSKKPISKGIKSSSGDNKENKTIQRSSEIKKRNPTSSITLSGKNEIVSRLNERSESSSFKIKKRVSRWTKSTLSSIRDYSDSVDGESVKRYEKYSDDHIWQMRAFHHLAGIERILMIDELRESYCIECLHNGKTTIAIMTELKFTVPEENSSEHLYGTTFIGLDPDSNQIYHAIFEKDDSGADNFFARFQDHILNFEKIDNGAHSSSEGKEEEDEWIRVKRLPYNFEITENNSIVMSYPEDVQKIEFIFHSLD